MVSVSLVTDAIWGGFSVPWCESGSRVFRASLTMCGRTKRPEVKETRKQMYELSQLFGTKPERRLAVVILVGSLVTLVGAPILSHLAVRRPDFP